MGRNRADHRISWGEWIDSYVQTCDVSTPRWCHTGSPGPDRPAGSIKRGACLHPGSLRQYDPGSPAQGSKVSASAMASPATSVVQASSSGPWAIEGKATS